MSDIGTSTNGAFDAWFYALQGLGALVFLVALAGVRRPVLGLRVLHGALCAGLPAVWLFGWPVTSGIEGAARFLIGAPATLLTGVLGLVWAAVAGRRSGQGGWAVAWPQLAALGLGVAAWGVFVAS